jgi:hypothetical protein
MLQFVTSALESPLVTTMIGAFLGAAITLRLTLRQQQIAELRENIDGINKAIAVSSGVFNSSLNLKSQILLKVVAEYETNKEYALKRILEAERGGEKRIALQLNLLAMPEPSYPVDSLLTMLLEQSSVPPRGIAAATQLIEVKQQLVVSIRNRNEQLQALKQVTDHHKFAHAFFGLQDESGNVDKQIPDTLNAIVTQNDEAIYFSHRLCRDLTTHGEMLKRKLIIINRKEKISVYKVDWSEPERRGLVPADEEFSNWQDGFKAENKK